jgi:integrase/recombinase XerD
MPRTPWEITPNMFLSVDESDALLTFVRHRAERAVGRDATTALLDRVIVEGLLFSGLRCSEFCRLTLRDVNLGNPEPAFTVRGPGRERRTVHISSHLSKLIQTYVRQARAVFLPEDVKATDGSKAFFFNEHHRPFERTGLYRRVVRILTEAGLGDRASVQLLRHTYGYLAYLRTGGNLLFVQRQLGHAHPMITSVYARFVEHSYSDMAERVAGGTSGTRLMNRSRKMKGIPHGIH